MTAEEERNWGNDNDAGDQLTDECWSCPTHAAVVEFARNAYLKLARKIIFRLQRIDASGVYGDDYCHKTLWDEYCHEVQEGPYMLLEAAWDATIDPLFDAVIESIPPKEATLLTIGAAWDLDRSEELRGAEDRGGPRAHSTKSKKNCCGNGWSAGYGAL